MIEFKQNPFGDNAIAKGEGFAISYNPCPAPGTPFASDTGGPETAIVYGSKYYVLNGDFREEYKALIPFGVQACINFFLDRPALHSSWSNQP